MTPVLVLDLSGGELRLGLTSALKPYCETNCWARSWPKGSECAASRAAGSTGLVQVEREDKGGLLGDVSEVLCYKDSGKFKTGRMPGSFGCMGSGAWDDMK